MKCKCEWCDRKDIYSKESELCHKHYQQFKRHGKLFKTSYDPNDIIQYDSYAEIILRNRQGEEIDRAIIDNDCVDEVSKYKWCRQSQGYVICRELNMYLHMFILGVNDDIKYRIDHINRNPMDNRKENLRYATAQENSRNKSVQKNNTSGHTGVYFNKASNKWQATIWIDGEPIYLGVYESKEIAIKIREEAEEKYFGEFKPNFKE